MYCLEDQRHVLEAILGMVGEIPVLKRPKRIDTNTLK